MVFFAGGVAVLLMAINMPFRFDEDADAGGWAALNAISASAAAFGLGMLVFPWGRFRRNAFAVAPVAATSSHSS